MLSMRLYESRIASLQRAVAFFVMFHQMGKDVQASALPPSPARAAQALGTLGCTPDDDEGPGGEDSLLHAR